MSRDLDPENILGKYVLNDEGDPVPEPDLFKWAQQFETTDRVILQTRIGSALVSTIFLGLDYGIARILDPTALPQLFETMVFGDASGFRGMCYRYASKLAALQGHARLCAAVERFDTHRLPRRLKKAVRKYVGRNASSTIRPGERRRVAQWQARVDRVLEQA